jgi:hypothetical protein
MTARSLKPLLAASVFTVLIPGLVVVSSPAFAQWYVPVGGSAVGVARANACANGEGVPVDVSMLFSVYNGALPADFKTIAYNPNPTDMYWASTIIETYAALTATDSATPGDFDMWYDESTPQGGCPTGTFGGGTWENGAVVVAGITGPTTNPDYVWWLNIPSNQYPSNYPNTAVLTLPSPMSPAFGAFTWTITTGTSELEFSASNSPPCASATLCITSGPGATSVMVDGIAPSPPMTTHDITITVTTPALGNPFGYGITYKPFKMTVREPYQLTADADNPECVPYTTMGRTGWRCTPTYQVHDQNCKNLGGGKVPINEDFGAVVYQSPYAAGAPGAWVPPIPCDNNSCTTLDPNQWHDTLLYWEQTLGQYIPDPIPPQTPFGTNAVYMFGGSFFVGSATSGNGVPVQSQVWWFYADHGDHEMITTPIYCPGS